MKNVDKEKRTIKEGLDSLVVLPKVMCRWVAVAYTTVRTYAVRRCIDRMKEQNHT